VTWAYFDTSALVKRYVNEAGRPEVLRLLRHHDVVTSAVLPVEIRGALRRRASEGSLAAARVPEILRRVATDRAYWTLVEVGREVLARAEALVTAHPLRTLDAIHVASAQLFSSRLATPELIFVSADGRQTAAAAAGGLTAMYIQTASPPAREP